MKLTNFNIDIGGIGLLVNDKYLDLHNNYDFRSDHYDATSNSFEIIWTRSHEDWANEDIAAFKIIFNNVSYLNIRERDSSLPFTDDRCLHSIGFESSDRRDDHDSDVLIADGMDADDLNIVFYNDRSIKINSRSADFIELQEEVIYVPMRNEGTSVWRPMWADRMDSGAYRVKSFPGYDPNDEELEFVTCDIVICEVRQLSGGKVLVATSRLP